LTERRLLLGNEAIARGLIENGCAIATSYPGTPASEILAAVASFQKENKISMHTQWAINEKTALEIAYAGCQTGLRTAVAMKQVGLNVASDPLMSAAYMGTKGGFIVISADDPGPISSQTEQDSRLMAMMARIPVLDPDTPLQAKEMIGLAYELSETFNSPVMLRPTTRVCHSRQDVALEKIIHARTWLWKKYSPMTAKLNLKKIQPVGRPRPDSDSICTKKLKKNWWPWPATNRPNRCASIPKPRHPKRLFHQALRLPTPGKFCKSWACGRKLPFTRCCSRFHCIVIS